MMRNITGVTDRDPLGELTPSSAVTCRSDLICINSLAYTQLTVLFHPHSHCSRQCHFQVFFQQKKISKTSRLHTTCMATNGRQGELVTGWGT